MSAAYDERKLAGTGLLHCDRRMLVVCHPGNEMR
jgi:hypothetical protein